MNANVETKEFRFDLVKWIVTLSLLVGVVVANSLYAEVALLYRVLAIVVVVVLAALLALNTEKGNAFWELLKAAQIELRKIVWPTTQEVNQTSMLVVVVVVITALILWGLDALIGVVANKIIG
jgi:preprotein translocase subunit SecE